MYKKAFREVYEILEYMDEADTKKISKDFITYVLENADWDYDFKYDENKSLEEQNLQKETEIILTMIYFKYFISEEEKIELIKQMKQNDIDDEKIKVEKYKDIDIFQNSKSEKIQIKEEIEKDLQMITNEKWYQKIWWRFKSWLKK